jgi:hypothetical protein
LQKTYAVLGKRQATTGKRTVRHSVSSVLTDGDELFFQLDGTSVDVNGETWQIEVCGVHSADSHHWIQLSVCGNVTYGLTLKADDLDPQGIRQRVAAWLPHGTIYAPESGVVSAAAE